MALLTINGVASSPSDLQVGIMDLNRAERNANGNMTIERINTKRKLELTFQYMDRTTLATLLNAVAGVSFSVTYPDPRTNALETKTFYCGDRSIGLLDYLNNVPRYRDVRFNLIEL